MWGGILSGILGGLGGLFGNKSSESYVRDSRTDTTAEYQDLDPELLKALNGLFMSSMGSGGFEMGTDSMMSRLGQLNEQAKAPQFDVEKFAKGIMDQATAGAQLDLESGIHGAGSATGGSASGNSMAALLANKVQNQTAANLAGIGSEATATGEQIRQAQQGQLTEGIMGLSSGLSQQLLALIGATRGASTRGKSTSIEHTEGRGTSKSGGGLGGFLKGLGGIFGKLGTE